MLLMLNQMPLSEGMVPVVDLQSRLVDEIQGIWSKEGWAVLVGPKHFAKHGIWTISIWVKTESRKLHL
jgi:hypothetical protein